MPRNDMPSPRAISKSDIVPSDWMDDGSTNSRVTLWGQQEYDKGYAAGRAQGKLEAFTYLIEQATELFKAGNDAEAMRMRGLATHIKSLE